MGSILYFKANRKLQRKLSPLLYVMPFWGSGGEGEGMVNLLCSLLLGMLLCKSVRSTALDLAKQPEKNPDTEF